MKKEHDTLSQHHILPLKVYLGVGGTLLVLTAVTVWVAQFHFGSFNIIVAMGIAAIKASLVAFFFMHLFYDNKLYFAVFAGSLVFLAIFIVLTMYDTERRAEVDQIKAHPIESQALIYQTTPDTAAVAVPEHSDPDSLPSDTGSSRGH